MRKVRRMAKLEQEVVIVGSGAAGHSCARTLRSEGFEGRILLVNGEGGPAVNRTLVDTGVLPGLLTGEQIALPPLPGVEIVDARAVRLGAAAPSVTLDDGRELSGDALVLACGSVPRALGDEIEVDPAVPLHTVHSVRDAERLRSALPEPEGARLVVLGSGFIGAEVASHYAGLGARVVLVGRSGLPLRAALGSEVSARLAALHEERVDARFGAEVRSIRAAGSGDGRAVVELAGTGHEGSTIEADAVVVAVGSRPATEWTGFEGPIPVDDRLRVPGRPGLYAAGSAAAPELAWGSLRLDHWDAAVAQGAHAAKALLHDLGSGADPGAYAPITGFTLMAYGAVVAARGVRVEDAQEESAELEGGGLLTELSTPADDLTGLVGWNAGPHLARAATRLLPE